MAQLPHRLAWMLQAASIGIQNPRLAVRKAIIRYQERQAPSDFERPSSERMPIPPEPEFPVEIQWNIDGFKEAVAAVGAAVPWPGPPAEPKRRVVMLAISNLRIDPRIEREARALAERGYEVIVVAPDISNPPLTGNTLPDWGDNVTFHVLPPNDCNFMGWAPYFYSKAMIEAAASHEPFAIHANDLWTALIGLEASRLTGAKCVADFHEWTAENVSYDVKTESWRAHDEAMASAFLEMEILTLRRAALTITVNNTIARALENLAGLDEGAVAVIRNIPKIDAVPTREYRSIKKELGLPKDAFVVLYQGGTGPSRLIEPIIQSLVYAKNAYLVIRGPSLDMYGDHYRRVAGRAGVAGRVILSDAVPSRDVVAAAAGADAGVWSLPDISKNFRFALPNKVFEYLAAGLPLLVANYPEPRAILDEHQCGLSFDPYSPKSIGTAINKMMTDRAFHAQCRRNVPKALESLDAKGEWSRYADLFDGLWEQTLREAKAGKTETRKSSAMRVLHAPCNVGNQPWTLSRAERALGLKSELVINYGTKFEYPADRVLGQPGRREMNFQSARTTAAAGAPYDYDAFHYNFGRSLSVWDDMPDLSPEPFKDLKTAKKLGKTVVMTLQGCDVRLAAESNAANTHTPCNTGACPAYQICLDTLDDQRRQLITEILPLCDRVFYLNPELGHFVPNGEFLPYANVDINAIQPRKDRQVRKRPRIVHAPSQDGIKGTPRILKALESAAERHDFELVLVQNKTHAEAMELYRDADLAIDQALAGWYGGVAVELMAMGVPVMSYIRDEDLGFIDPEMKADLPILRLDPDHIDRDIDAAFARREEWNRIGEASRHFVEKWHNPATVAMWLKAVYADPAGTPGFSPDRVLKGT